MDGPAEWARTEIIRLQPAALRGRASTPASHKRLTRPDTALYSTRATSANNCHPNKRNINFTLDISGVTVTLT